MKYAIFAVCLLTGCTASPEYRANRQAEQAARERAYYAGLAAKCEKFGFRPSTDAFAGCIQTQHMCEQQKSRAQTAYFQNLNAMGRRPGKGVIQNAEDAARLTDMSGLCH